MIKVTRAHVYAARTRVILDRRMGRETPAWVLKLASVKLP